MSQASQLLARSYAFNVRAARMTTDGFTHDDWAHLPSDAGGNTAHWILGHLVSARLSLARRLGAEAPELEWEPFFERNATPSSNEDYPAPEELLAELESTGARITRQLEELSDEQAAAEWGPFPDGGRTLLDGAQFLFFHESYHLGQLGLIRRAVGKPGFA